MHFFNPFLKEGAGNLHRFMFLLLCQSDQINMPVEECFLNLVGKKDWIPERVWLLI